MKKILLIIMLVCLLIQSKAQSKDEQAVRNLMALQVLAWNTGSIDTFMQGYWQNDSLLFIGNSGVSYGWKTALSNYKKHYPDSAAMGKLQFDILQIKPLSTEYIFVLGKWQLTRKAGNIGGYYTLLFKKIREKWLIIADHTS